MNETWFIKNTKLLDENSRIDSLLDLSSETERFLFKLESIKESSVMGFIWRFWTGKSNFLNQIKLLTYEIQSGNH